MSENDRASRFGWEPGDLVIVKQSEVSSSLPGEVRAAIRKEFGSDDMRKKATMDAESLHDRYHLQATQWDKTAFRRMAEDKGWTQTTFMHRWYVFSRLLSAMGISEGTARPARREGLRLDRLPSQVGRSGRVAARSEHEFLSEDAVKGLLEAYLSQDGWDCSIRWGREPGIDIEARRGHERWVIEVKGQGSLNPMRVNYFLGVLGETLQRMSDDEARYSIALPDIGQFRRLWGRLPQLAKRRTGITALFVQPGGRVTEVE